MSVYEFIAANTQVPAISAYAKSHAIELIQGSSAGFHTVLVRASFPKHTLRKFQRTFDSGTGYWKKLA